MKFWGIRLLSLVLGVAGCFAIEALSSGFHNDYVQRIFFLTGIFVTLAVSLNLINGITGQFSIGHAAFYQVGAYTAAFLATKFFGQAHLPETAWLFVMMIAGAAFAGFAGLVVGLPSLRLRGDYLAIVTLGFGEIIRIQVQNTDALGGAYGINVNPIIHQIWVVWFLAFVCIALCRNLLKTAHGLPFLAVREDEVASSAMGVDVTRVKVAAFVIGSAFAGAAGALMAHYEGFISPTNFTMDQSFIILTMVVLGGTGSITGSAVAAVFLAYLPEYLRGLKGPDGNALTVTGASVLAALIATVVAAAFLRRATTTLEGTGKRWAASIGAIVGGLILKLVVQAGLSLIPVLRDRQIEANQLRMMIFAVTLIIVMLLRPQGIFAHHEFSWSWVGRLFGRKGPKTEIAAA